MTKKEKNLKIKLATSICILGCPRRAPKSKVRLHTKECDETWIGLGLELSDRPLETKPIK